MHTHSVSRTYVSWLYALYILLAFAGAFAAYHWLHHVDPIVVLNVPEHAVRLVRFAWTIVPIIGAIAAFAIILGPLSELHRRAFGDPAEEQ